MLILLSPEIDVPNEHEILHSLFENELEYYHLRKPFKSFEWHVQFIGKIEKQYHNRIVLHSFHELLNDFNLKGIHLKEKAREQLGSNLPSFVKNFQKKHKTVSSAFHDLETIEKCEVALDYYFLSPVFTSISKFGYEGKGFSVLTSTKKIIGVGGIAKDNIVKALELGYKGIGALGSVWTSTNPLESFLSIKEQFEKSTYRIVEKN